MAIVRVVLNGEPFDSPGKSYTQTRLLPACLPAWPGIHFFALAPVPAPGGRA